MIGNGFKKLAAEYGMTAANGVAYGSLMGYASTFSEGSGYKRIDISTKFTELESRGRWMTAIEQVDITHTYRVQNLEISTKCITVIFQDTIGTLKKIRAFIDWFYPLLGEHGAVTADVCLECGTQITDGGWYLINGIAYHLHDGCAAHVQREADTDAEKRRQEDTGSYLQGSLGAFLGAALGAVVWAIVLSLGYVASLVGLLIGWLAEKGYTLMHGRQGKAKIVILIFAILFGVLLGTIIPDVVYLVQMINAGELPGYEYGHIPMLLIWLLQDNPEYLQSVLGNVGIGLLFAAIGVYALLKKTGKEVSDVKVKKLK